MLSLPTVPILKSLSFQGQVVGDAPSLETYFQRAGGELESLILLIEGPWQGTLVFFRNNLRYLTALRDFSFLCPEPSNIIEMLLLLPAFDWNSITVFLQTELENDETFWGQVDTALSRDPKFRNLRRFVLGRIGNTNPLSISMVTELILTAKVLLPMAHERGILYGHGNSIHLCILEKKNHGDIILQSREAVGQMIRWVFSAVSHLLQNNLPDCKYEVNGHKNDLPLFV
ncbi:hypothetical protein DFH07DRAFT_59556 [Mycena maculata]|uniref:Uncharacterized protein n=1 Tax=Mycena maculata TaxID=230809 RepID=A0AAD7IFM5_9AGAR|nr:hypothetical protein DFH07DRAFT_59556 [Mycena maculata]